MRLLVALLFRARRRSHIPWSAATCPQQPPEPVVGCRWEKKSIFSLDRPGSMSITRARSGIPTPISGGTAVSGSVQHIWRTRIPIIYRSSRQGDFAYNIPLKPGIYELRLHFAENLYGPENAGGGGEGSRTMTVSANGADLAARLRCAGRCRGRAHGGSEGLSRHFSGQRWATASELPSGRAAARCCRRSRFCRACAGSFVRSASWRAMCRTTPNDSRWWSPDAYFKGGQMQQQPGAGAGDRRS